MNSRDFPGSNEQAKGPVTERVGMRREVAIYKDWEVSRLNNWVNK